MAALFQTAAGVGGSAPPQPSQGQGLVPRWRDLRMSSSALQGLGLAGAGLSACHPRLTTGLVTKGPAAQRERARLFPAPAMTGTGKYQDRKASKETFYLPC